jgi:four helix bundle protein
MAGVKRYEDLVCWRLSYELQQGVFAVTETGLVTRDLKFCDQIRESSRSATRNIAEGFGRFEPTEFRRFLRIARGSLTEIHNHLRDGRDRGYFSNGKHEELALIANRAAAATTRLMIYLHRCDPKQS